jgi:uncharacterized protein YbjQ (UPF0145 family)
MPFWKKASPEEQEQRARALQEAEESRRSLEAGSLPLQAKRRLAEETAAGHPIFSSDLSVNEFALTGDQGYIALSQVMGSSIYQVGWQYTRNYTYNTQSYELTVLTDAHQHAASLALQRLEEEATLLKAQGVIGVRFARRDYEWGQNLIEYTAIGTAIKLPDMPAASHPFLSDLSGQEFWTLLQAGYYPVGLVYGYCSYYTALGSSYASQLRSYWYGAAAYNQEIRPFTQGFYTARHMAFGRMEEMARRFNAVGIVGTHIETQRNVAEYEQEREGWPTQYYMDLKVDFAVVGTAITAVKQDHTIPKPQAALTLTDLRPGQRGEVRELTMGE